MNENIVKFGKGVIASGAGLVALDAMFGQSALSLTQSIGRMADNPMRVFDAISGSFGESKLSSQDFDLVSGGRDLAAGINNGLSRVDAATSRLSWDGLKYVWQNDSDVIIGSLVVFGVIALGLGDREMRKRGLESVGKVAPENRVWSDDYE